MKLKTFLFFNIGLLISFSCLSQLNIRRNPEADTSVFYSILILEKSKRSGNLQDQITVVYGSALDSIFILSRTDTIAVKYDFPNMQMSVSDYKLLKSRAANHLEYPGSLLFKFSLEDRSYWLKTTFYLFFDKYWLEIFHERKGADKFTCTILSESSVLNTNNISSCKCEVIGITAH